MASINISSGPFIICDFSSVSSSHTSPVLTNGEKKVENKAEPSSFQPHCHFTTHPFLLPSHLLICHDSLLDVFHIVGRIEACLSILEPAFAPTLIIFFANFGELVPWRKQKEGVNETCCNLTELENMLLFLFLSITLCFGVFHTILAVYLL